MSDRKRQGACHVYVIAYEHRMWGHAVKVGITSDVAARLRELQTANPDTLEVWATFRFDRREIALEVERLFHDGRLVGPIRGEWVSCVPQEAVYYVAAIAAHVLEDHYHEAVVPHAWSEAGVTSQLATIGRFNPDVQAAWRENIDHWARRRH